MPLSDTQAVILNAACQRDDRIALPLPESLKGGAAMKVVASMINKGLLKEVDAKRGQTCWRQTADGDGRTLVVTDAGLEAIGIESEEPQQVDDGDSGAVPVSATGADTGASAEGADHDANAGDAAPTEPTSQEPGKTPKVRASTKQAILIDMLKSADGATIEEVMSATGWQSHTVRGAIAGALKKRLGLTVTSEKVDGRGRVYRLPPA
jgi:hypothetical protein